MGGKFCAEHLYQKFDAVHYSWFRLWLIMFVAYCLAMLRVIQLQRQRHQDTQFQNEMMIQFIKILEQQLMLQDLLTQALQRAIWRRKSAESVANTAIETENVETENETLLSSFKFAYLEFIFLNFFKVFLSALFLVCDQS